MLRKLSRRLSYANVMSTLAVVVAVGTGGAYAANTIRSTDIVDGEVGSADIKDNSVNTFDVHSFLGVDVVDDSLTDADLAQGAVTSSELASFSVQNSDMTAGAIDSFAVQNGSLNDEDIGQVALNDFVGAIGVVPASSCVYRAVTGITSAGGDHLLLTANTTDAAGGLIYSAEYQPGGTTEVRLKVCNPFASNIDDGNTHFNLLTIDAQ